jgi:hypothetical protein
MPVALVPRPWDFVDPPMNDKVAHSVTPGPATQKQSITSAAPAGLAPQTSPTEFTEPVTETGETSVDEAFMDETPLGVHENGQGRREPLDEGKRAEVEDATVQITDTTTPLPKRIQGPDTQDD